ncbi:MAG TPA: hypothetical protein VFU99_06450, partial [Gaiellaceae bacterium]|nr:hypothetical protein [Gaiellaceae bacterium]
MTRALMLAVCLLAFVVGCGDDESSAPLQAGRVYFLLGDQVWPASRDIPEGDGAAEGVVAELVEGPDAEEAEMGLTSSFPDEVDVSVAGDVASVEAGQ